MIVDAETVKEVDGRILGKLINKRAEDTARLIKLKDYYLGKHDVLYRRPKGKGLPNNKTVCNHAKYIVDMTQGYLLGAPIAYSAADGIDIEPLKNAYFESEIQNTDSRIVRDMSIYGHSYELVYANEDSKPKSAVLEPRQAFIVYDDTVEQRKLFGVHYYTITDIDGLEVGKVANVYTENEVIKYRSTGGGSVYEEIERTAHSFGRVPMIEYINNEDKQGDFEQLIGLIDAYNTLMSDRVNYKEQFVDAILFLKNVEVDSEKAKELLTEKIMMSFTPDAEAKYLQKVLNETDVEILRNNIKDDLHKFSLTPDLTDENFGNNLSGVAIRYKLLGFEQHVKNKERFLVLGLKERFDLYVHYLSLLSRMSVVSSGDVDFVFNRNLPENNLELAQTINYLRGLVSDETLLEQLDFVSDSAEEMELVEKQEESRVEREIKREELYRKSTGADYTALEDLTDEKR